MKKLFALLICFMLIVPVLAAPDGLEITFQPQNYVFPENGTVSYTVRANGTNLRAFWYMEYEGTTYEIPEAGTTTSAPWTAHVGGSYGAFQDGKDFGCYFNNASSGLNGAKVWCVVEDGHFDTVSDSAIINISGTAEPPLIQSVPARVEVKQGEDAEIIVNASSSDGSQLSYLWYETSSGRLQDIVAMNRGTEDSNFLFADTSTPGTRYYVCMITTSSGGCAYTSVVPVTVEEAPQAVFPEITTTSLPDATAGTPYSHKLSCQDPNAHWTVYYVGPNDPLSGTGFDLSRDGTLSGTPKAAGRYTFNVCAAAPGGQDYAEFTLTVLENQTTEVTTAPTEVTTEPTQVRETTLDSTEPSQVAESEESKEATETPKADPVTTVGAGEGSESETDLTWLWLILIALAAAGIGALIAWQILKKKK